MSTRPSRPSMVPLVTTVPDLLGRKVDSVDDLSGAAGLVANLNYRPKARQTAGTVVAVHPAAGSAVVRGSAIQVSVAGGPGTEPADRRFIEETVFAELEHVRAGVTAEVLRAAGITVRVDPVAGAVRVEGDLPAEVAAVLAATYGAQLVMSRPAKRAHAADRNTRM